MRSRASILPRSCWRWTERSDPGWRACSLRFARSARRSLSGCSVMGSDVTPRRPVTGPKRVGRRCDAGHGPFGSSLSVVAHTPRSRGRWAAHDHPFVVGLSSPRPTVVAAVVLASAFAPAPPAGAAAVASADGGTIATTLVPTANTFPTGSGTHRQLARDCGHSVEVPGGRSLWVFCDTADLRRHHRHPRRA